MSKAERRKRSRERQRQREAERKQQEREQALETGAGALPATEVTAAADVAASAPPSSVATAAPERAEPESPFITGPVVPRGSRPVEAQRADELLAEPLDGGEADEIELGDFDDEGDDLGEEDDGYDGDEDDDDDDDLELEDCLFEAACGAVEQGPKLAWSELCAWLAAAEITDPRLALLIGLLCEDDTKLTGERVLATLEEMELGELAAEARELVAEEAEGESDPEERAVVRTTSRELKEQAEQHLGGRRDERKPVKSTQLRQRGAGSAAVMALAALGGATTGAKKP